MPHKRTNKGFAKRQEQKRQKWPEEANGLTCGDRVDEASIERPTASRGPADVSGRAAAPTLAEILQETMNHLEEELETTASSNDRLTSSTDVALLVAARPADFLDTEAETYSKRILHMLSAEHVGEAVQPLAATVLQRQVESLYVCTCQGFTRTPAPEVRDAIMQASAALPHTPAAEDELSLPTSLNPSQRAAVVAATVQTSTLIWGPPGTGKTQVAEEIMRQWTIKDAKALASPCQHLLATSDTNCNVDNMAERFSKRGLRVLRCGRFSAVRECNRSLMLGLPAEHRGQLRDAQIIACTAIATGSNMFDNLTFARVLIDEAAQISEPSVLVPLARGCKHLVQMGDFKQLPPTVQQQAALDVGLGESLFERLYHASGAITLSVQYRMHPHIASFPKAQFYRNTTIDNFQTAGASHAMTDFDWLHGEKAVHFIEVSHFERCAKDVETPATSYCNVAQVMAVEHALADILKRYVANDVGVISPYRAQVTLLRDAVPGGVEVMSVDACQGQQKPIIILSTVRANSSGKVGFLGDARRINVAFTRAQRAFIVIGSRATLQNEYRTWRPWLEWVDEHGVVSDWNTYCQPGGAKQQWK